MLSHVVLALFLLCCAAAGEIFDSNSFKKDVSQVGLQDNVLLPASEVDTAENREFGKLRFVSDVENEFSDVLLSEQNPLYQGI